MKLRIAASLLFSSTLMLPGLLRAQPFQKFYDVDTNGVDVAMAATTARTGGFLIVQRTHTNSGIDTWLVRIRADGSQSWKSRFSGFGHIEDVIQTPDDGFAMIGETDFNGLLLGSFPAVIPASLSAMVVKVDSNGNLQWKRKLKMPDIIDGLSDRGPYWVTGYGIALDSDGRLMLSGRVCYFPWNEHAQDGDGCMLWTAVYESGDTPNLIFGRVIQHVGITGSPSAVASGPGGRPFFIKKTLGDTHTLYGISGYVRFDGALRQPAITVIDGTLPTISAQVHIYSVSTTQNAVFTDAARLTTDGRTIAVGTIGDSPSRVLLTGEIDFAPTNWAFGQPGGPFNRVEVAGKSPLTARVAAAPNRGPALGAYGVAAWVERRPVDYDTLLWVPGSDWNKGHLFGDGLGPFSFALHSFRWVEPTGDAQAGYMLYSEAYGGNPPDSEGQLVRTTSSGQEELTCHCDVNISTEGLIPVWTEAFGVPVEIWEEDLNIVPKEPTPIGVFECNQLFTPNCPPLGGPPG